MSDFIARAMQRQDGRQGPKCGVSVLIARMEPEYRKEFLTAVNDATLRSTVLCEVLMEDGIALRPETLQRHRSGRCACPRT